MRGQCVIFFIFLLGAVRPLTSFAQHTFDDLPVDDPSLRSALGPHENAEKKIKDNLFVVASFNRPTCYPGEQILLTYRLYTALQSTSTIATKPSLNGFTAKERKPDETPLPDKIVDGRHYHGFTVWQVLLTPLQAGKYTIDPLTINNDVSYLTADGRSGRYSGSVNSNTASILVQPLPAAGQPPAFTGPIGRWQIHSRLAADRLDAGENDTLLVEMDGFGSFDNVTAPPVRWPAGFRHFDPVERWDVQENSFPHSGKKIVAIPFTATTPGKYTLPSLELAYFDPAAGKYHVTHTDSMTVHVFGSRAAPVAGAANPGSAPPGVANPGSTTPGDAKPLLSRLLFPLLIVTAILLFLILRLTRRRAHTHPAGGSPAANPSTQEVKKLPEEELYLTGVKKNLITFLQSRLKSDAWAEEELVRQLQEKNDTLAAKIRPALDLCNRLLYSPYRSEPGALEELSARVTAVLNTN